MALWIRIILVQNIYLFSDYDVVITGICEECGQTPASLQWMYPEGELKNKILSARIN